MKKILYLLIAVFSCGVAYGQADVIRTKPVGQNSTDLSTFNKSSVVDNNLKSRLTLYIPTGSTATLNNARDSTGAVYFAQADSSFNVRQGGSWIKFKSYASAVNAVQIQGGTIYSLPAPGDVVATGSPDANWRAMYQKTTNPTAGLSGGVAYERHASGTFSSTLNWSYGKTANTANIVSATITGNSNTYPEFGAQPGANSSITGTQAVTGIPYNSSVVYTMFVTTTDGKIALANSGYSIYDKGYAGWATSGLSGGKPIQADVLAANIQDNSGGSSINTQVQAQQGSDKNYFFVTTTTRSHVSVNGTPSDAAFTFNVPITFTNSNGGTFNGYAHVSNFQIGSTGAITFIFN